jgi:uncharacterized membrane protein YbhN (UPF0104 family)
MMIILNVILMALVGAVIVTFLAWSICTQHRDAGCEHLRIRLRLRTNAKPVMEDESEIVPGPRVAAL